MVTKAHVRNMAEIGGAAPAVDRWPEVGESRQQEQLRLWDQRSLATSGRIRLRDIKDGEDWIQEADTKIKFLNMTTDSSWSCAGAELTDLWTKEARIRFTNIAAGTTRGWWLRWLTPSHRSKRRAKSPPPSWSITVLSSPAL